MGYTYCDLKPNNIMIKAGVPLPKIKTEHIIYLVDFGLSVPSTKQISIDLACSK